MKKREIIENIINKLFNDSKDSPNPFSSTLSNADYEKLGKSYYAEELLRYIYNLRKK